MMGAGLPLAVGPMTGRVMGKYEILCRLSTGGMSAIYLALQKGVAGFGKLVVLKSILPTYADDETFVRMFLDEAQITAGLSHPNIATVFDLDRHDGDIFLAMEFVQGCTLVELFEAYRRAGERLPLGLTLAAARDAALALHHAHTFRDPAGNLQVVVHRDVAGKNIMMTFEGVTKLLDFGLAKMTSRVGSTGAGVIKGTGGYMSPEQIRGELVDPRSDIFSLGVVLHELITGERLFRGETPELTMVAALSQTPRAPSKKNAECPKELDEVVLKALARERDRRHLTALDFARAIERAAEGLLWQPEQRGAAVQRLFAERREQMRLLYERLWDDRSEVTGERQLRELLASLSPGASLPGPRRPPKPAEAPTREQPMPQVTVSPAVVPLPRSSAAPWTSEEPSTNPDRDGTGQAPVDEGPHTLELPRPGAGPKQPEPDSGVHTVPLGPPGRERITAVLPAPGVVPEPVGSRATSPGSPAPALSAPEPHVNEAFAPEHDPGEADARTDVSFEAGGPPGSSRATPGDRPRPVVSAAWTSSASGEETRVERPRQGGRRGRVALMLVLAAIGGGAWFAWFRSRPPPASGAVPPARPPPVRAPQPQPPASRPGVSTAQQTSVAATSTPAAAEPPPELPAPAPKPAAVEAPRPPAAPTRVAAPVAKPKPKPRPRGPAPMAAPEPARPPPPNAVPATQPAKSATGLLTLICDPWAKVALKGQVLGDTPLLRQAIPAGRQVLKLTGGDGKSYAVPVDVKDGAEVKLRLKLSELTPE